MAHKVNDKVTLQEKFNKAIEDIKKLKYTPSEDDLLAIYSLYKQAQLGDCNTPKPGMFDFIAKAKWDAWTSRAGLSKEEAQELYIEVVAETIKKYEFV